MSSPTKGWSWSSKRSHSIHAKTRHNRNTCFFFFSQQPIKSFQSIPAELEEDVAQSYFAGTLTKAKGQLHRYAHCTHRGSYTFENSGLLSILLIPFMHSFSSLFRRTSGVRRHRIILLWYIISNMVCIFFTVKSPLCCVSGSFLLQVQPSPERSLSDCTFNICSFWRTA